nr:hypothetical protein [Propionibacterium sp.]
MSRCTTCGTEGTGPVCAICGTPYLQAAPGQPTPVDLADTLLAPAPQWTPTSQPTWSPAPPRRRTFAPAVAAGAVVVVLAAGAALLGPRLLAAGASGTPAPTAAPTVTAAPEVTPTLARSTSTAPANPAPAVTVTTTVVRPAGPDALSSTYVMVLASLDKNTVTLAEARAQAAALASASGRAPKVLDSSATAGMNAGYWAIVDGPHGSEAAARASCAAYGRTQGTGECYLRVLG